MSPTIPLFNIPLVYHQKFWAAAVVLFSLQCISTIFCNSLGRPLPHDATVTDLLCGRLPVTVFLFLFLFLTFPARSIFAIALALYNSILLASLLEHEKPSYFSFSTKRLATHGGSLLGVICVRILLGYLLGRGTGFAYPVLFFNDAIHETTSGLSIIILYFIGRRAFGVTEEQLPGPPKWLIFSLIMWLPNAFRGPIFFWSFSSVAVAGIQGIISLLVEGRPSDFSVSKTASQKPSRTFRLFRMIYIFLLLSIMFAAISLLHFIIYQFKHNLHTRAADDLSEPVLAEFLVLSYPRRDNSTILSSTLQSYVPGLSSRFRAHVYTTVNLSSHTAFADAQTKYKGYPGLSFYQDAKPAPLNLSGLMVSEDLPPKQTMDLYAALAWSERDMFAHGTRYLGIMEDDFEWCPNGFDELKAIIYEVELQELAFPSEGQFCGIFIATGGSGLLVRPSVLPLLQDALQKYASSLKPDIIVQDCLQGKIPLCNHCKLSASRRLLLRHTGARESTYHGRVYPEDRWQCGWRQPFNGKLGVWVP